MGRCNYTAELSFINEIIGEGELASLVDEIARSLGIEPRDVEKDALKVWLEKKLRLIEAEISEVLNRYGVKSARELEDGIARGEVPEHPGWEDLIVLNRLIDERKRILEALERVSRSTA